MIEDIRYIEEHLPLSERLAQLAEEAAELAQAARWRRRLEERGRDGDGEKPVV